MKEIKATAPTPQDWIELVRENERLKHRLKMVYRVIEDEKLVSKFRPLWDLIIGEQNK